MAKNRRLVIYLFAAVITVAYSFRSPEIDQVYLSQVGKTEHPIGSNWGHPVQEYLASTGLHAPDAWCAAFVHWCLDSAGIKNQVTAYSPSAQNKKNLIYYQTHWLKPVRLGDVFTIYFPSMKRIAHTGFVNMNSNTSVVETVEGNSNAGGSREGYGVFRRKRPALTLWSISRWE